MNSCPPICFFIDLLQPAPAPDSTEGTPVSTRNSTPSKAEKSIPLSAQVDIQMIPPGERHLSQCDLLVHDILTENPLPLVDFKTSKSRRSPLPFLSVGVDVPPSHRSELAKYFTIDKGKIIATILAVGFILHHGVMRWRFGADSCNWLLTKGRFQGRTVWQPYGCMMHDYSMQEAHTCLR